MTDFERIVIVGAGVAGLRAAERLRELDYDGELVIIGDEPRWPYHRPLVSKDLLSGGDRPADLTLQRHVDTGARWRLGTRAERLETTRKVVHLPGGEEIKYDGLIIATGVEPRHLKGVPRHSPRLHTLRTVDEALEVKKTIARSDLPIVVLGTGYIGCDVAASARKMGRDVTMVGRSRFPLRNLGNDVAAAVDNLHRKHRARMAMGTDIRNWITADDSIAMHTTDGQLMVAGCVILAVGSVPAVEWMRGSGLVLEDGVLCESTLFAAGVSDVTVAGDCARWPNLRFDETPRRVEHWINAVEMGRAAAENLLVGREEATPFTPIPRVWSGQYGVRLQVAGMPSLGTDTVHLSDGAAGTPGVTGYVRNGRLVGVCGWDTPRAMLKWTEELHNLLPVPEKRKRPVPSMPAKAVPAAAGQPPAREDMSEALTVVHAAAMPVPAMAGAGRAPAMNMAQAPSAQSMSTPTPAMAVPAMASLSMARPPAPAAPLAARHRAAPGRGRSAPATGRDMPIAASSGPVARPPARSTPPARPSMPLPMSSGHMPPVSRPSGQMPSGRMPIEPRRPAEPMRSEPSRSAEPKPSGRRRADRMPSGQMPSMRPPAMPSMPISRADLEPITEPIPAVRPEPEPGLPETTAIPNLSAPNLSLSNLSVPNIVVPDTPAAAMRPAPPPARQRRADSQPLPPMPPPLPLPNQHPSFPAMRPVQRPPADLPSMDHPSFPAMRPVQRPPADMPMDHPSFAAMRPVQRPPAGMPMEHPSFAAMRPVQRPPSGMPMEHPSFPAMRPVARPDSESVRFPDGAAIRGFG